MKKVNFKTFGLKHKSMVNEARSLGFSNSLEAEQAGHSDKLKHAFNNPLK